MSWQKKPPGITSNDEGKKVWKPKRAAGVPLSAAPNTQEQDVVVFPFGSSKRLPAVEALRLAKERAGLLEDEMGTAQTCNVLPTSGPPKRKGSMKEVRFSTDALDINRNPMAGGLAKQMPEDTRDCSWHWGKEVLPLDFSMMDFSDLEESTRALYFMKDDWLYADEVTPVLGLQEGTGKDGEQPVDVWWSDYQPVIADRLIPFVKNVRKNEADERIPFKDSYFNALDHLAEGGSLQEQQLALVALEAEKARGDGRAGNEKEVRIAWGSL